MREIAEEAGLSVGVAYRYFDTKVEFIGAAMDRIRERLARAAAGQDAGMDATYQDWLMQGRLGYPLGRGVALSW